MKQKLKTVIGLVILAGLLTAAYFAYQSLAGDHQDNLKLNNIQAPAQEGSEPPNQEGSEPQKQQQKIPAPDFTVYDGKGQAVKLSDYQGQPVVINIWASWCPPCREELPDFNQAYQTYKDDVVFMMVDLPDGLRETQEKAEKYIIEQGFVFPLYFDNDQQAAYAYGAQSIPLTVFVDRQGNIAGGQRGMIEKGALNKGIELILKE